MTQIKIDKELRKILKTHSLIEFSDGLKYTGMTKKKGDQLIAHGLGFGMWPNGHSYKGQFKNGQFHGWGNYISPGNYEYSGLWKNNILCKRLNKDYLSLKMFFKEVNYPYSKLEIGQIVKTKSFEMGIIISKRGNGWIIVDFLDKNVRCYKSKDINVLEFV